MRIQRRNAKALLLSFPFVIAGCGSGSDELGTDETELGEPLSIQIGADGIPTVNLESAPIVSTGASNLPGTVAGTPDLGAAAAVEVNESGLAQQPIQTTDLAETFMVPQPTVATELPVAEQSAPTPEPQAAEQSAPTPEPEPAEQSALTPEPEPAEQSAPTPEPEPAEQSAPTPEPQVAEAPVAETEEPSGSSGESGATAPSAESGSSASMENLTAEGSLDTRAGVYAFPGADGYAKNVTGGRGGIVVKVNSLGDGCNADGQINVREAVERCGDVSFGGPITIVYDIGGTRTPDYDLRLLQPGSDLTFACATAPSPHVMKNTLHFFNKSNVIARHCITRSDVTLHSGDGIGADRAWNMTSGSHDFILDHISVSWTSDSNVAVYQADGEPTPYNFTFSNSNLSRGDGAFTTTPGLYDSAVGPVCLGNDESNGTGISGCSFIGNFMAHNNTRNAGLWSATGEYDSNVVYNWVDGALQSINIAGFAPQTYAENNLAKRGPASSSASSYQAGGNYLASGNYKIDSAGDSVAQAVSSNPGNGTPSHARGKELSYEDVLSMAASPDTQWATCVGASAWGQDAHDRSYIMDFFNGTGPGNDASSFANPTRDYSIYPTVSRPSSWDTDNDGMADAWEQALVDANSSLNSIADIDHLKDTDGDGVAEGTTTDLDGDGYSDLEEYINEMSRCPDVAGF